jgi:L-aminopeptidase/D-esterase-like protein
MNLPDCDVGHWADPVALTGVTVFLPCAEDGAICGVDIRGGAPGSRETELLRPERTVERVHGLVFTGGSAFGLGAADGVMRYLAARGRGVAFRSAKIPIVPASVIFDLGIGAADVYPDAEAGMTACASAQREVTSGSYGAGIGATVGKARGLDHAMRGGFGVASTTVGTAVVAAAAVVNALGDIIDANGRIIAGTRNDKGGFADTAAILRQSDHATPTANTTLVALVTNAQLDVVGCTRLAAAAHDGIARAIHPAHTLYDGDTAYALSTGSTTAPLLALQVAAAEVTAEAIRAAVLHADSLPGLPAARDWPPQH